MAFETEKASKAAKKTVYGSKQSPVFEIRQNRKTPVVKKQSVRTHFIYCLLTLGQKKLQGT